MKNTSLVSTTWLKENFDTKDLIILDASPKSNVSNLTADYPALKIKNARPFDMSGVFVHKDTNVPNMFPLPDDFQTEAQQLGISNESILVVYDNLGIYTSPRAWWMLKAFGHKTVYVLDGGLTAWKNEGGACESIEVKGKYEMGNFKANLNKDFVVSADEVLENIVSQKAQVCDARGAVRFNGEAAEPRAGMKSGHIPKSQNIPFKSVLQNGKMKSKKELELLFQDVDLNKEIIFTCGSGVTACVILLAASQLSDGSKALYDGSWAEWGRGKYPVEK